MVWHAHDGRRFLLTTILLEGFSPVLMHRASGLFAPVPFLLSVMIIAAGVLAIMLLVRGECSLRCSRKAFLAVAGVAVCNMTAYALILVGTRTSSGVSTALLMQSEMVWTLLLSWFFLHERVSLRRIMGILTVLLGAITVLWRGVIVVHKGELLIVCATMLYPFGNTCAKHALRELSPLHVLLLRYLLGIVYLLFLGFLVGQPGFIIPSVAEHWLVFLTFALVIFVVSKICWYEGLKRHDLHLSVATITAVPALAMVYAYILLGEVPSLHQWIGLAITVGGLYLLFRRGERGELPEEAITG